MWNPVAVIMKIEKFLCDGGLNIMAFLTYEENGLIWLSSDLIPVPHGFSTRAGGVSRAPWDSLNLRTNTRDDPEAVRENYRRFCAAVSAGQTAYEGDSGGAYAVKGSAYAVDVRRVVLSKQVHETIVRPVTAADAGKGLWRDRDYQSADALITDDPGVPLFVFSADCGNILLYDSVTGAVGAVHAGWRGCAGGIVEKAVKLMERRYGSDYPNLYAAIGPCIGPCCFETDHDVPDAMRRALGPDADAYLTPPFKETEPPQPPLKGGSKETEPPSRLTAAAPLERGAKGDGNAKPPLKGRSEETEPPQPPLKGGAKETESLYRLSPGFVLVPPENGRSAGRTGRRDCQKANAVNQNAMHESQAL